MTRQTIRAAFITSVPVLAGYIVLGIGFGILLRGAGYGVGWAAAMSALIYGGSMQYVGVGLLASGASIITTALTSFMVNARHLFLQHLHDRRVQGRGPGQALHDFRPDG